MGLRRNSRGLSRAWDALLWSDTTYLWRDTWRRLPCWWWKLPVAMSSSSLQPTAHNDAVYKMGVRSPGPLRVQFDGPGPAVLRLVLLEHQGWVEWDEETDGPHDWHLHWRSTRFKPSHYKLALPFQRLNHLPRSSIITKKDTLQKNLRKFHKVNGSVFDFYPQGFILPTEYTKFLKEYQRTGACLRRRCRRGHARMTVSSHLSRGGTAHLDL